MAHPKLGQRLSLISKAMIRYEGTLSDINPDANTLTIAEVSMFGTENRPAAKWVASSSKTFEYIVFRGNDIHDLTVYEEREPPTDPAIVSTGPVHGHHGGQFGNALQFHNNNNNNNNNFQRRNMNAGQHGHHGGNQQHSHHHNQNYNQNQHQSHSHHGGLQNRGQQQFGNKGGKGYMNRQGGKGGFKGQGKGGKRSKGNNYSKHTGLEFSNAGVKKGEMQEFDFEEMQKKAETIEKEKTQKGELAYKKESSFFDNLTAEEENTSRFRDNQTFGKGGKRRY